MKKLHKEYKNFQGLHTQAGWQTDRMIDTKTDKQTEKQIYGYVDKFAER